MSPFLVWSLAACRLSPLPDLSLGDQVPPHRTPNVRPRYTGPGSARPRPAPAPAIRGYMVRYSGFPIRHTEFGIRKSKIGNRGTGNLHGAVEWAIHPFQTTPGPPIRGFSFLSVRYPRNERAFTSTIKRAPSPLSAPAIDIHPSLPNQYFVISGGFSKTAAAAWGPLEPPAKRCGVRGF
jgi:hypothetical protein